jgi:PKD repeat protein
MAQVNVQGQWRTLPYVMPINPIHIALTYTGRVLIVAGSGNNPAVTDFRAAVWDPGTGTIYTQPVGWDMFCNGMVALPDGRIFINGGNFKYDPFWGEPRNAIFDPVTSVFTDVENMAHGRWYPTVTVLGDGRVLSVSGLKETGGTNTAVEIYTVGSGWSQEYQGTWTPPLYPRMHLLTNGRVAVVGPQRQVKVFDLATKTWTAGPSTIHTSARSYGTSVLLPLKPSEGYKSRIMIMGGGNPATNTTEILDMSAATPQWVSGPAMSQGRIEMNATILPNGKVLAMGGSVNDEDVATASYNADLYDPAINTFSSAGRNAFPRLYHSGSLLLPDATVALLGGNPQRGSYENRIEIYSPAYLFATNGSPAVRPVISGAPAAFDYGTTFQVQTPDAASIASVVLVRPGASTHAFDMDQRLVQLSFTKGTGVLTVTAPPNGNVAPPGYYMLFVLNSAGVPSVATFVRARTDSVLPTAPGTLTATANGTQSTLTWTAASDNVGVTGYRVERCQGSGCSNFVQIATVTGLSYVNSGLAATTSYSYRVRATDASGNAGPYSNVATATTGGGGFSLSASPASQTVARGATTTYSVTVTPDAAFTGTVTFSATGLPANASASFNPPSLSPSGVSTLTVSTSASTPAGSYPLTIRGTSGPLTRTAAVTLVVSASQPPTATITRPSGNVTINPGGVVSFAGSGTDPDGSITSYSWSFPGGTPSTSTVASPGNVTYSTPGTYTASLTVTDNSGATSSPATRTVTIADFSLSASPSSRSVSPGAGTTYNATVTPGTGFTGTVGFSVTGLPTGASATFNPTSVTTSGQTTLTISTSTSTPGGSYSVAIRGTSGTATRTATVTLVVVGNFSIQVTPASRTIAPAGGTNYTVTVTSQGFSGTITLSVAGLPKFATANFTPSSLVNAGISTLAINSNKKVERGTYQLTITGTGGSLTRSTTTTLVVQ